MSKKHYWWSDLPGERYWCEITDRVSVGDDLLCPQSDEGGKTYWSYSLILLIRPGDLIFHYYTPKKAFVGASLARGVAVPSKMSWVPHGTAGRGKAVHAAERPAWSLPIVNFVAAGEPLTLAEVQNDDEWVRKWIAEKRSEADVVAAPFQPYPGRLRGYQGYLTKMPLAFVHRWSKLQMLADQLSGYGYVEQLATEFQDVDDLVATVVEDVCYQRSQGFCASPKARRAIEQFAVLRAKQYYEALGYVVEVRGKPYDLRCSKFDSVLHVEVKGTTTTGQQILLTPNEVAFVTDHSSSMALFIVSGLQVSLEDEPKVSGGTEIEIRPWQIQHERWAPIGYSYSVPRNASDENVDS
jgi:Domain of unknown function (DUF3883)